MGTPPTTSGMLDPRMMAVVKKQFFPISDRPEVLLDGRPYRLVGVVEDINDQLRMEELDRAREAAEAANRARQLAPGMALPAELEQFLAQPQ